MSGSLFNIAINLGQQNSILNDVMIPVIGIIATLAAGFGGVWYGAKLTDDRRKKEEQQNNINKAKFLHSITEKYLLNIIQFYNDFIKPKNDCVINKNCNDKTIVSISPHVKLAFPNNISDYSFMQNDNSAILNVLYMLIYHSKSFEEIILEHDKILSDIFSLQLQNQNEKISIEIFKARIASLTEAMHGACNNVIFFADLLYINLTKLILNKYKISLECAKELTQINIFELAKQCKGDLSDWIVGLENSWNE